MKDPTMLEMLEGAAESNDAQTFEPDQLPPPYSPEGHTPLAISMDLVSDTPETYVMHGHYSTPDFDVVRTDEIRVLELETHSSQTIHETFVRNRLTGKNHFTMKRHRPDANRLQYRAFTPGQNGSKIFEFELPSNFTSRMVAKTTHSNVSTRLVFRNIVTDELDAIDVQFSKYGREAQLTHRDRKLGTVEFSTTRMQRPEVTLSVLVPGVDPLLFVVLAAAVDERTMTQRRRLRSHPMRGALGIGKGPGAGLAGLWALGTLV